LSNPRNPRHEDDQGSDYRRGKKCDYQRNVPARSEELDLNLLGVLNNKRNQGDAKEHCNSHGRPCRTDSSVADAAVGSLSGLCLAYWLFVSRDRLRCVHAHATLNRRGVSPVIPKSFSAIGEALNTTREPPEAFMSLQCWTSTDIPAESR
jgi:hypothetical protein